MSKSTHTIARRAVSRAEIIAGVSPKRNKFGAKRVKVDGIWFDSKGEAARYSELKLEERAGDVRNIKTQVAIPLIAFSMYAVGGEEVGHYKADYTYERRNSRGDWFPVVEDFKGEPTAAKETYRFKRRMFRANYGFDITETKRSRRR